MAFDKTRSAGYLANHMARLFALELQRAIRPFGLAPAQFMTLLELWTEDALTQKQLVERLNVEQATMANTIRRMERDGWVRRENHPKDRRAQIVYLTKKALKVEMSAKKAAALVNERALAGLPPDGAFIDHMKQVIASLKYENR